MEVRNLSLESGYWAFSPGFQARAARVGLFSKHAKTAGKT